MTVLETPPAGHVLAPRLEAFARRQQLLAAARASMRHMADCPPVDPDPSYTPKHRRTTT